MSEPPTVLFDIHTPLNNRTIKRQIKQAMALGLKEADPDPVSHLNIVANGPSARGVTFQGPVLALNGAINLFPPERPPNMWAACDPQALVADFLQNPSLDTTFLVASKCHPSVFKRLAGHDVRLWHINDQDIPGVRKVPTAVSVTLCALMLMHRLGWRKIDVWGWDCCFGSDGSHHASGEGAPPMPGVINIEVDDGRFYKSTATWAAEVKDASGILPVLAWCGTEVNIHGDGMVAAICQGLKSAA